MITRKTLARRTFLRGLGTAVGLPFLDAMAPAFDASTVPDPPVRMAFFYLPNGMIMDAWNPGYDDGPLRELPRTLKALEPYRADMLHLGNLTHNTGRALLDGAGIPHVVLDRNMSVLAGFLGIHRRILVDDDQVSSARRLLLDAGLAKEMPPDVG